MKNLYCRQGEDFNIDMPIKVFEPSLLKGFFIKGEIFKLRDFVVRLLFWGMTAGKAKIFYLNDENGELMHTSYVVPYCIKFPFMNKNDYQIGPCFTYPKYRGQGLYPMVLKIICSLLNKQETTFYMIVDQKNISSIRGVEKAGFKKCAEVYKSKYLKRYHKIKD